MTREAHVVQKEMGYTHEEFLRLLPKAVDGAAISQAEGAIEIGDGERRLRIELGPEGERQIGLFRLPVTPVSFIFSGYDASAIEAALDRFWRAYQKGGG